MTTLKYLQYLRFKRDVLREQLDEKSPEGSEWRMTVRKVNLSTVQALFIY